MKNRKTPVVTVGSLREAMKDLSDDQFIHSQVVASDGTAWNMCLSITPEVDGTNFKGKPMTVMAMDHPQLQSLNPMVLFNKY